MTSNFTLVLVTLKSLIINIFLDYQLSVPDTIPIFFSRKIWNKEKHNQLVKVNIPFFKRK